MGGVSTGLDALELDRRGRTSVALGTVLFADPDAPARVRAELHAAATARGWQHTKMPCGRTREALSVGTTLDDKSSV